MMIIAHRRNTIEQLRETPRKYGIEVDIRSRGDQLIIHHDALQLGGDFDEWLSNFKHGTLILNVKEEGLEQALLARMEAAEISDFFFLDQSFPFLVKTSKAGERRCAVRVSEFETIDTALTLSRKVDWVWVDCFSRFPLTTADAYRLRDAGFKLCVVSPELQGRTAAADITNLRDLLSALEIAPEAVCTKRPDLWE